jgi:hypothetical protein
MKMLWEKLSMFDVHTVVADLSLKFPREGDQFIMQVLVKVGYTGEALHCLNRVQVSLQLLFMLDILTASGNKVGADTLSRQPQGEVWSMMRWPNEHPTDSDMRLWRDAMHSICPSRGSISGIGCFIGHCIEYGGGSGRRHTQPSITLTSMARQRMFLCWDGNLID